MELEVSDKTSVVLRVHPAYPPPEAAHQESACRPALARRAAGWDERSHACPSFNLTGTQNARAAVQPYSALQQSKPYNQADRGRVSLWGLKVASLSWLRLVALLSC